jgi:hypothetical protein
MMISTTPHKAAVCQRVSKEVGKEQLARVKVDAIPQTPFLTHQNMAEALSTETLYSYPRSDSRLLRVAGDTPLRSYLWVCPARLPLFLVPYQYTTFGMASEKRTRRQQVLVCCHSVMLLARSLVKNCSQVLLTYTYYFLFQNVSMLAFFHK